MSKKCSITSCTNKHWSKGFCGTHLWRFNHGVDLNKPILKKHGLSDHPLYMRWAQMRARCNNPSNANYAYYGGRGIRVCKRWNDFKLFLKDMGNPPSKCHSLDRIDQNGDYEPNNVIWATPRKQAQNTRRNRLITIDGVTKCFSQWARESKLPISTISTRYYTYGWPVKQALTQPRQHRNYNDA